MIRSMLQSQSAVYLQQRQMLKHAYRTLVANIADSLDQDDVKKIVWLFSLPAKVKDYSPLDVFELFHSNGTLSESVEGISAMTGLLQDIQHNELVDRFIHPFQQEFCQPNETTEFEPRLSRATCSSPNVPMSIPNFPIACEEEQPIPKSLSLPGGELATCERLQKHSTHRYRLAPDIHSSQNSGTWHNHHYRTKSISQTHPLQPQDEYEHKGYHEAQRSVSISAASSYYDVHTSSVSQSSTPDFAQEYPTRKHNQLLPGPSNYSNNRHQTKMNDTYLSPAHNYPIGVGHRLSHSTSQGSCAPRSYSSISTAQCSQSPSRCSATLPSYYYPSVVANGDYGSHNNTGENLAKISRQSGKRQAFRRFSEPPITTAVNLQLLSKQVNLNPRRAQYPLENGHTVSGNRMQNETMRELYYISQDCNCSYTNESDTESLDESTQLPRSSHAPNSNEDGPITTTSEAQVVQSPRPSTEFEASSHRMPTSKKSVLSFFKVPFARTKFIKPQQEIEWKEKVEDIQKHIYKRKYMGRKITCPLGKIEVDGKGYPNPKLTLCLNPYGVEEDEGKHLTLEVSVDLQKKPRFPSTTELEFQLRMTSDKSVLCSLRTARENIRVSYFYVKGVISHQNLTAIDKRYEHVLMHIKANVILPH